MRTRLRPSPGTLGSAPCSSGVTAASPSPTLRGWSRRGAGSEALRGRGRGRGGGPLPPQHPLAAPRVPLRILRPLLHCHCQACPCPCVFPIISTAEYKIRRLVGDTIALSQVGDAVHRPALPGRDGRGGDPRAGAGAACRHHQHRGSGQGALQSGKHYSDL